MSCGCALFELVGTIVITYTQKIPGIGPITTSALVATIGDASLETVVIKGKSYRGQDHARA